METSELDQLAQLIGELHAEVHSARQETNALRRDLIVTKERTEDLSRQYLQSQAGQSPLPGGNPTMQNPTLPSTSSTPVQITLPGAVPLAPPERFTGDPRKYASFMTQCRLHFLCRPGAFPNDQARVAFVLSYLSGSAADWSVPLVTHDDPILHDLWGFQREMEILFARHTREEAVDNELLSL
ncbi:protein LDOC1-like [Ambystoma mexicanum]|uniref:protein LDOC1-like n=1 Tax=Ambystoma mexicanum TaxID=8296 RepID=UPI0037E83B54